MKKRVIIIGFLAGIVFFSFLLFFSPAGFSQDRAQDGWGIVTDQEDDPQNDVWVEMYERYGPGNSKRRWVGHQNTHYNEGHGDGYYSWDLPTGMYDLLVKEGTADEGGYAMTYLPAGQWPDLVRNIKFGTIYAQK